MMKKLLLIIFLSVVTLFLVGCANKTSDEEILQQYDFVLGTIKERNNADDGYTYTIEIENEISLIKSNKLFSVGDIVLLVEVQENKSILIDLD
jgi:uncharacterized lipoprotein NlpE involved in copper resistance